MRHRALLLAVIATLSPQVARAQADTGRATRPLITWQDGLLAWTFVAVTAGIAPLDRDVANRLQKPENKEHATLHKLAKGFNTVAIPGALIIGGSMYAGGKLSGNDKMADLGLHGTEALLIGGAIGMVMKGIAGRERPYVTPDNRNPRNFRLFRGFGSDGRYRSFPSGHTVSGFAAAAAVTAEAVRWWPELRWVIGPTMYGGAALIGLTRMYDDRHWASDVIMGAAIGTFAGSKVVRYHHDNPDNKLDEWLLNFTLTPAAGGGQSLSFSVLPAMGARARPR